ncbi:hypothetical protein ZIOFF_022042 [Zingiber officinale]|uniref:Uncharacterized protein n=1 Tax=Zingiber officinale TaxID=94328 RepID=A0A8J5HCH3_ZINOF|nr:hypothetical protein ZIOFF_022042 [Zingiber officinale]
MLKRWPSLVSKLVLTPTAKLQDSKDPKHLVLVSFTTFIIGLLTSSHHESLKAQKAIIECVAAEVMAGILHSEVNGLSEEWNEWLMDQLHKIMVASYRDNTRLGSLNMLCGKGDMAKEFPY